MRNLKILNALSDRGLVHNTTSTRQLRVVSGNSRTTLWQYGTRASITTGVTEQQEQVVRTFSARNNGRSKSSARGSVRLHRQNSTNNKSKAFDVADARAYCSVLLRSVVNITVRFFTLYF